MVGKEVASGGQCGFRSGPRSGGLGCRGTEGEGPFVSAQLAAVTWNPKYLEGRSVIGWGWGNQESHPSSPPFPNPPALGFPPLPHLPPTSSQSRPDCVATLGLEPRGPPGPPCPLRSTARRSTVQHGMARDGRFQPRGPGTGEKPIGCALPLTPVILRVSAEGQNRGYSLHWACRDLQGLPE